MTLKDKEILMLKDKDDGSNLEESIYVVPTEEVWKSIKRLKENIKNHHRNGYADFEWFVRKAIDREFGERNSEGIRK